MFRLQYLLIMMKAPNVTPEKTEFEIRKMKWIRFGVVSFLFLVIPIDFSTLGSKVTESSTALAVARLILGIVCMTVEAGTLAFLLSCFIKMQTIFRSLG